MKILALRSVPLSQETRQAWASAGVKFAKRTRTTEKLVNITKKWNYEMVLNLGGFIKPDVETEFGIPFVNPTSMVRSVSRTERLRKTIDGYGMPEYTHDGPHWHKTGGWGGSGVKKLNETAPWCLPYGESQAHVDGVEYRVNTVADIIVQAQKKINVEWGPNGHSFDYEWVGVEGIGNLGIIPLLKEAVVKLPGWEYSTLGWDIIVGEEGAFVLEANSSPGVNEATAKRIVSKLESIVNKEDGNA